jgi:hypothetical protein
MAGAGFLVGSIVYFVLGFIFLFIRPEHAHQIGAAIGDGFGVGFKIISAATLVCVFALSSRKNITHQKQPGGSVRQQLLNARADIQQRIEVLQSSPVHNYRGGIPLPDILIEELAENLKEIDIALAIPEPNNA